MLTRWRRVDALEGVLCKRWRQGGVAIMVMKPVAKLESEVGIDLTGLWPLGASQLHFSGQPWTKWKSRAAGSVQSSPVHFPFSVSSGARACRETDKGR